MRSKVDIIYVDDFSSLPLMDESFDFVWNVAALWHLKDAPSVLDEMARVSSNFLFISQNNVQIGYYLRKFFIDKDGFRDVYEEWLDTNIIKNILSDDMHELEEGFYDIPPWLDTGMPIGDLLNRFGIGLVADRINDKNWNWDIMNYYTGIDICLKNKIESYMILERRSIPNRIKALWAHYKYILLQKN